MIYLGNLINSCKDYGIVSILAIIKNMLSLMQLIVPIVLIASCIWQLVKMLINPEDKKGLVNLKNKIMAALIFIFLPFLMNLTLSWVSSTFHIGGCFQAANEYKAQLDATEEYDVKTQTGKREKIQKDISEYHFGGDSSDTSSDGNGSSNKKIKGTAKGKEIVEYALKFIGKPYVWGGGHGTGHVNLEEIYKKGGGVDCSGFTAGVYQHFGYMSVTGTTYTQEKVGRAVSYSEAQAGDLILYEGHVAIFMGDGNKIVHASTSLPWPQGGVKITNDARFATIKTVRRVI